MMFWKRKAFSCLSYFRVEIIKLYNIENGQCWKCTILFFKGRLYIIVEYCLYGNLRNHLLNNRQYYVNAFGSFIQEGGWRKSEPVESGQIPLNQLSTKDLICFAFQVARGMAYLESRKVKC